LRGYPGPRRTTPAKHRHTQTPHDRPACWPATSLAWEFLAVILLRQWLKVKSTAETSPFCFLPFLFCRSFFFYFQYFKKRRNKIKNTIREIKLNL
jgi:hypothetical protein